MGKIGVHPIHPLLEFTNYTWAYNWYQSGSQLFCRFNHLLKDLMAQESITRRGKEITSTSSSEVINGNEKMCFMWKCQGSLGQASSDSWMN